MCVVCGKNAVRVLYLRSPGLASPPLRNFTPSAGLQPADMSGVRMNDNAAHLAAAHPAAHLLQHITSRNNHNVMAPPPVTLDVPTSLSLHNTSPQEVCQGANGN